MRVVDLNKLDFEPIELDGTTTVLGAVLILRTVSMTEDGNDTGFILRVNGDTDFVTLRGLVELARDHVVEMNPLTLVDIDDDDDPGDYSRD